MIALLLDREFNHSRKCLEVPICEKLDSRNIWRIQYIITPSSDFPPFSRSVFLSSLSYLPSFILKYSLSCSPHRHLLCIRLIHNTVNAVQLRTRRALSPHYRLCTANSALLVPNGTSLNSNNALLALNSQYFLMALPLVC